MNRLPINKTLVVCRFAPGIGGIQQRCRGHDYPEEWQPSGGADEADRFGMEHHWRKRRVDRPSGRQRCFYRSWPPSTGDQRSWRLDRGQSFSHRRGRESGIAPPIGRSAQQRSAPRSNVIAVSSNKAAARRRRTTRVRIWRSGKIDRIGGLVKVGTRWVTVQEKADMAAHADATARDAGELLEQESNAGIATGYPVGPGRRPAKRLRAFTSAA